MKDREISRLVLLNVGLGLACVLSGIFFFWLHGSIGSAPGGATETASDSLVRFAPTTRSPEAVSSAPSVSEAVSPAPSSLQNFVYKNTMSRIVSGECNASYFVILVFPSTIDYRQNNLGFVFNTAYPCTQGTTFSKTLGSDVLHLSEGVSYYVVRADEKNSGTWYNPR